MFCSSQWRCPHCAGQKSDILRIFTAGDYRLSLSIQRTPASPTITLEGNLLDPGDPSQSPVDKVHLLQAVSNELIATQALDDFGLFSFSVLLPNTYILAIELASQTIRSRNHPRLTTLPPHLPISPPQSPLVIRRGYA